MVSRDRLGEATKWLQRRTCDDQISTCFCKVHIEDDEMLIDSKHSMYVYVRNQLKKEIKKLIADMLN